MLDQKYRVRVNRDPLVSSAKNSKRKKKWLIWGAIAGGVLLILVVILVAVGGRDNADDTLVAPAELKLVIEKGDVQIKRGGEEDFDEAIDGMTLEVGTTVRTEEEALVSLELIKESSGSVVRLNESSRLEVKEVSADGLKNTLSGGEAWVLVTGDNPVKTSLETNQARVEAQSTTYNVRDGEDTTTIMAVGDTSVVTALSSTEGEVTEKGKLFLEEDQQTTIQAEDIPESEDDFDTADLASDFVETFWARWNSEKDTEFVARLEGQEDEDGPKLEIKSPEDGFETDESTVEVKGVTDLSATVEVNGEEVDNELGSFSTKVDLEEGENKITVIATDPAGNQTKEEFTVIRTSGKPQPVSVSLNSDEEGSILITWTESEEEAFGSYVIKRAGEVIERITDQNTTELRDSELEAGKSYSYNVCVIDEDGQEGCSQDQTATVKGEPNQAPSVNISSPADAASFKGGTPVTFAASGSDPDGESLTYTWDFGDGVQTTGQSVTHTYSVTTSTKSYTVKVTVSDRSGAQADSTISLKVTP
ncbi:MAG: PKD domain-containing protein [Parcubacteria group bacterium]